MYDSIVVCMIVLHKCAMQALSNKACTAQMLQIIRIQEETQLQINQLHTTSILTFQDILQVRYEEAK